MANDNLPKISDIYKDGADLDTALQKNEQFLRLINQQPPREWVEQCKFKGNTNYLPIGYVEFLLKQIFKENRVEILREAIYLNAAVVTVRVHYKHPVTKEWTYQDGIGASDIQTKTGCSPADLVSINSNAVGMAFPCAESEAIKDACHKIGDIFGGNLNRKKFMPYEGDAEMMPPPPKQVYPIERAKEVIPKWVEKGADPTQVIKSLSEKNFVLSEEVELYIKARLILPKLNTKDDVMSLFDSLPETLQTELEQFFNTKLASVS